MAKVSSRSEKKAERKCQVRLVRQAKFLQEASSYKTVKEIAKSLGMKENSVYQAILRYRKKGLLNKDRTLTSKGKQKCQVGHGLSKTVKSDVVRGHNIVFTVGAGHVKNWGRRREVLEVKKVSFEEVGFNWRGERVLVDDVKVWLTPKSVVVYMPHYWGEDAEEVYRKAVDDLFLLFIPRVERMLGCSLKDVGGYKVRVSRQHYGLVKNALAEQYHSENRKLFVRDGGGLWLLIDNSLNLRELETVHSKTGVEDNVVVQDFFNDLKEHPILPSQVEGGFARFGKGFEELSESFRLYDRNIKKHLSVLGEMSRTLKKIEKSIGGQNNG